MKDEDKIRNISVIWIFLTLLSLLSHTAFAYTQDDLRWKDVDTQNLTIGGYILGMGYKVQVVDFPAPVRGTNQSGDITPEYPVNPSVIIKIYEDSNIVDQFELTEDGSHTINDDIKVTAEDLPSPNSKEWIYEYYRPWVNLKVQEIDRPAFNIDINMSKTDFGWADTYAEIKVNITNIGTESKRVNAIIDTKGLNLIRGVQRKEFSLLKENESVIVDYGIEIPRLSQVRKYNISVNVSGTDIRNRIVYDKNYTIITVGTNTPLMEMVNFTKYSRNKTYLGDNVLVLLTVENKGDYDIESITVEDSIPNNFKLIGNQTLKWSATFDRMWTGTYILKPEKSGTYDLPVARAIIKISGNNYDISSNIRNMEITGPDVKATKSASRQGNIIKVNVKVENNGNAMTSITIRDEIPEGYTITKGEKDLYAFLDKGSSTSLYYEIKMNNDQNIIYLPPATVYYSLIERKDKTLSNNVTIGQITTPVQTPEQVVSTEQVVSIEQVVSTPVETVVPVSTYADIPKRVIEKEESSNILSDVKNIITSYLGEATDKIGIVLIIVSALLLYLLAKNKI